MKTITKLFALALLSACIIYGCKKDDKTTVDGTAKLAAFFDEHKAPIQTFKIAGGTSSNFLTGTKGVRIFFAGQAFKLPNGQYPTDSITIELREILTKKDMILSGAFPVTANRMLQSGGEIYLNATCNGQQLIPQSNYIHIYIPSLTNTPMNLYYGYGIAGYNLNTVPLTWQIDTSTTVGAFVDSSGFSPYYYSFNIDSLEWLNCDDVIDNGNTLVSIISNTSGNFNADNTMVFVSIDGMNSVLQLNGADSTATSFSSNLQINLGLNVHVLAISNINGQFYFCSVPYTLTATNNVALSPVPATEADILTALDNLP